MAKTPKRNKLKQLTLSPTVTERLPTARVANLIDVAMPAAPACDSDGDMQASDIHHEPLCITESLEDWKSPEAHSGMNGLLVKRPLEWGWDAHARAIDAAQARFSVGAVLSSRFSVGIGSPALRAAVRMLLTTAALPAPISEQIELDVEKIVPAVAAMCPSARSLELKLEIIGENTCSRWHQDNFMGRALVSYTGSGTMYTSDGNVDFWELQHCGNNDCIIGDASKVESVDVGDILFIKGKKYGRGSPALVHKAPPKRYHEDGRIVNRLVMKVDVHSKAA